MTSFYFLGYVYLQQKYMSLAGEEHVSISEGSCHSFLVNLRNTLFLSFFLNSIKSCLGASSFIFPVCA